MRLLVSGGGTGGHVYPALAIARAVVEEEPGTRVLYVGTATGLEASVVPREGYAFEAIPSRGMLGRGPLGVLGSALAALRGTRAALCLIRRFAPDVVVGTGGYVSGPVALAARLAGIPLVVQEQNVFPGVTNRLASRWAAAVAVPHDEAAAHFPRRARLVVTGNPVRRVVLETTPEEGRRVLGLPEGARVVYVVGGSQGARVLNEATAAAVGDWLALPEVWVVFACGRRYYEETLESLRRRGLSPRPAGGGDGDPGGDREGDRGGDRVILLPYLDRPDAALAAAEVVVTRGGATTLAEVACRGVPAVIVPSPNVAHNEQEKNARVFERAGAARVILETDLSGPVLALAVKEILASPDLRERMHRASLGLGRPGAAGELARLVVEVAGRRPRRGRGRSRGPDRRPG